MTWKEVVGIAGGTVFVIIELLYNLYFTIKAIDEGGATRTRAEEWEYELEDHFLGALYKSAEVSNISVQLPKLMVFRKRCGSCRALWATHTRIMLTW